MELITEAVLIQLGFTKRHAVVRIAHPKGRQKTYDYVYQLGKHLTICFTKDNKETQLDIQSECISAAWYDIDLNRLKGIIYFTYLPEHERYVKDKGLYRPKL